MANKSGDNSLRDWFGKSKSSDGTPGWVQLGGKYAGKPCARQPGQKTKPKCGSSKMKRNLNKKEEEKAFRRKNAKDPNPNRKGKAINVATEETTTSLFRRLLDEKKKCWKGYKKVGTQKLFGKTYNRCVKAEELDQGTLKEFGVPPGVQLSGGGGGTNALTSQAKVRSIRQMITDPNGSKLRRQQHNDPQRYLTDKEFKNRGEFPGNKERKPYKEEKLDEFLAGKPGDGYIGHPNLDIKNPLAKKQKREPVLPGANAPKGPNVNTVGAKMGDKNMQLDQMRQRLRNSYQPEGELMTEEQFDEAAGEKDACYHKVKSRYSVWPSAYASGALVKCRKVGAKNWGNKTKKEGYELGEMADEKQIDKKLPKKVSSKDLNPAEYIKNTKMMPGSGIQKKLMNHYSWRDELEYVQEGSAWTKKSGKDPDGGLNEKGRKSYERENPGSDLKRPSKKVGNKRRASFCARMKGMKKKLTSKKTANDPDSRINKSLRAWNC